MSDGWRRRGRGAAGARPSGSGASWVAALAIGCLLLRVWADQDRPDRLGWKIHGSAGGVTENVSPGEAWGTGAGQGGRASVGRHGATGRGLHVDAPQTAGAV